MTAQQAESGGAQSVDRALSLLSLVARDGGKEVPITTLTELSGLSRPTVRRMLLALMRAGLVEQNPKTRNYALGPESYVVGLMAQRRFDLLDFAMDSLKDLAAESGDSSFVSMRRGAYSVCLHREEGSYPIRTQALQVGYRHPLGVGAGAMAILAALPDDELALMREEITPLLAKGYDRYTPEIVGASIAQCRRDGWALNPGLYLANSWAIGVAIKAPTGDVLGALSIAAIDSRLGEDRQKDLAKMLLREAGKIESKLRRKLGYT
jgi:DNA-binding IclR family transcriptional regulator